MNYISGNKAIVNIFLIEKVCILAKMSNNCCEIIKINSYIKIKL